MTASRTRAWLAIVVLVLVSAASLAAGEPARPARPGQPAQAEQPVEKTPDQMNVEELRAYQAFYFAAGGRDPLTMRFPTSSELGLDAKGTGARIAPTIAQMEAFLRAALETSAAAVKALDYDEAIKVTGEAIQIIDNEWPPINPELSELVRMAGELRSYARLAAQLKRQEVVRKEFEALPLRVDGVIWSPVDAKAMINGRTLSAGEVLLVERKEGDLRIESIEEQGVQFQYKGLRFRKPVELYSPDALKAPVGGNIVVR